jgi:hypothetical protein
VQPPEPRGCERINSKQQIQDSRWILDLWSQVVRAHHVGVEPTAPRLESRASTFITKARKYESTKRHAFRLGAPTPLRGTPARLRWERRARRWSTRAARESRSGRGAVVRRRSGAVGSRSGFVLSYFRAFVIAEPPGPSSLAPRPWRARRTMGPARTTGSTPGACNPFVRRSRIEPPTAGRGGAGAVGRSWRGIRGRPTFITRPARPEVWPSPSPRQAAERGARP